MFRIHAYYYADPDPGPNLSTFESGFWKRHKKKKKLGKFIKEMFNYNLFVMLVFLAWYRYM